MNGAVAWGGTRPKGDVWPTAAQDLLLRAALLPDARALDAWREVRGRVDVAALDGPSQAVLPALRRNLTTLGVEDELMSLFKGVHRFTWARNQVLLHRMLPVVAALERAGVPTMLLKGAAFVVDARLDAGTRAMNDVDVLVPTDRAREAIEVLLAQGLVPVGDAAPWYLAAYSPRFVPSHAFRDGGDRQLDLHWHVLHASGQPGADDDFWAAAVPAELLGVRTRTLCPTDELLLVILHGLRWNAIPTYRWVIDATVLLSGAFGAVDFDRLVGQARKRRVVPALAAGLRYLRDVADVTVPDGALRALRAAGSSPLERFEFRTQMIQPRHRGVLGRLAVHHQQYVRRQLALGEKATVRRQVALARAHLGVSRVRDVRHVLRGGTPGPGRPPSEVAAAVGTGAPDPDAPAVQLDRPIDFGVAGTGRRYVAHGTWRPDADGCWIAGREARLVLPLSGAPRACWSWVSGPTGSSARAGAGSASRSESTIVVSPRCASTRARSCAAGRS